MTVKYRRLAGMKSKSLLLTRFALVVCALFLVAGSLAGCGRGVFRQAAQGGKPAPQGTLTLYDIGPITLDPAVSQELRSHFYVLHVFGGLVTLNESMQVVPDLASSWDVSPDGRVYTFHIRPEAKFQNGRPVLAGDVKFSWDRAANPATRSPTAETYLGQILGVEEVLQGKAGEISGLRVLDDLTLRVELKEPRASFLPRITYPVAFVVDRDDVRKGGEWWRNPNGSGPFRLAQWIPDELLELDANGLYHGDGPFLKKVVFRLYAGVPLRMYMQNEIDATDIGIANIDLVRDVSNPINKELGIYPELSMYYLAFNLAKPPFDDVNVRKAFVQALDKEKIIRLTSKGTVRPANGIIPVGMPGFNPDLKGLSYDVQAARELLARSRYGSAANLPPIILTTAGQGGAISDSLSAMVQQWEQNLGVNIQVRALEPEVFFYNTREVVDNIYDFGWVADYPDPENFLDILFHSGRPNNAGGYGNPAVDALLDRGAAERNEATRLGLYRDAEAVVVQDAALIPLWFGQNFILVKPGIQNYKYAPLGFPMLNRVYLGTSPTPALTPGPTPEITASPGLTLAPVVTAAPTVTPAPEFTPAPTPTPGPVVTPVPTPVPTSVIIPTPQPPPPQPGVNIMTLVIMAAFVVIAIALVVYVLTRGKKAPPGI